MVRRLLGSVRIDQESGLRLHLSILCYLLCVAALIRQADGPVRVLAQVGQAGAIVAVVLAVIPALRARPGDPFRALAVGVLGLSVFASAVLAAPTQLRGRPPVAGQLPPAPNPTRQVRPPALTPSPGVRSPAPTAAPLQSTCNLASDAAIDPGAVPVQGTPSPVATDAPILAALDSLVSRSNLTFAVHETGVIDLARSKLRVDYTLDVVGGDYDAIFIVGDDREESRCVDGVPYQRLAGGWVVGTIRDLRIASLLDPWALLRPTFGLQAVGQDGSLVTFSNPALPRFWTVVDGTPQHARVIAETIAVTDAGVPVYVDLRARSVSPIAGFEMQARLAFREVGGTIRLTKPPLAP